MLNENILFSSIKSEEILNLTCKFVYCLINLFYNGLIIRYVNLNLIGIANIHLELLYRTILFFSREALRRNVPKLNNIHSIYHYIHLIWLIIPIGIFFIIFILFIEINYINNEILYYNKACLIYALSAFIELLSEPFYLLATVTRNYYINIYIELFASIIGFGIQTILVIKNNELSLLYYGYGYIIYSSIITLSYYIYFLIKKKSDRHRLFLISSFKDLLIKPTSPFVDHKLVNQTIKYFHQGISIKILTDGEKYLIKIFYLISYEEQAIFHMIYILGSIFPRLIFSTIEQITFSYFQQTFSKTNTNENNLFIQDDQLLLKARNDEKLYYLNHQQPLTPNEERTIKLNALTLLNNLVRLLILISLLLITFIIPYSSKIINIYIGSNLSLNYSLVFYLRLYLINILLNSINVINESFIQSIMTIKQLNKYKNLLLLYSFIYLLICYIFIKLFGITGIIIVNCLNILGRIIINNYLINKYFIRIQWFKSYLFSSHYIFILLISLIICYISQYLIENNLAQITFSIGIILTIICITLIEEKQMIHYIYCVLKLNYHKNKFTFSKRH